MFDKETNFAAQGFIGGLPPMPESANVILVYVRLGCQAALGKASNQVT